MAQGLQFRKGDLVAVFIVVSLAVGLGIGLAAQTTPQDATVAGVYQDGVRLHALDLASVTEPVVLTVDGQYYSEITAQAGRICFSNSNCPGADCVKSGWTAARGRSLVCLPNRVEIRIESQTSDVDAVAR